MTAPPGPHGLLPTEAQLRDRLRQNPDDVRLWHRLGVILARQDRRDEQLFAFGKVAALTTNSAEPEVLMLRGDACYRLARYEDAAAAFDHALALQGQSIGFRAEANFLRGNALRKLTRLTEAIAAYDAAIALRRDYAEAWNHRGNALRDFDEHDAAIRSYDFALEIRPDYADAQVNRSVALRMLGRNDEAVVAARRALAVDPHDEGAYTSLGNSLRALGDVPAALACFQSAIARARDPASARFNHGLCLLLTGDFERGLPEYEARWQTPSMSSAARNFDRPLWLGQADIAGRTILLHAEQGLGDTIQFCRYAPLVAAQGATVLLGVPPSLRDLLRSLGGAIRLVDPAEIMPPFDFHCPLMSLPLAFQTDAGSIPCQVPYLDPPRERRQIWRDRIGPSTGLRVGLAWSGSDEHKEDASRSIPLETLGTLVSPDVEFICLQRDLRPGDVPGMAMLPQLRFFGHQLQDFADTASLIGELDLVISVDTAVLHLAGALGRPAWALLPFAPDWRWMLDRTDSPWYPTMRLFRQVAQGDWPNVIDRVRNELAALAQRRRNTSA